MIKIIDNYRKQQHLTTNIPIRSSKLTFNGSLLIYYSLNIMERFGSVLPISLPLLIGKITSTIIKTIIPSQFLDNNNTSYIVAV